jgi:hypothetical protein
LVTRAASPNKSQRGYMTFSASWWHPNASLKSLKK